MRKRILQQDSQDNPSANHNWLNLEDLGQVEVTSEDPEHPVEAALILGTGSGWRAAQADSQTIRLLFDETQFMQRLALFVRHYKVTVRLAYYPPYHSKYNPIERCWGILEHHWNGSILDSVDAVLKFAATMTWKGRHPTVELVTTAYKTGVSLSKAAMDLIEAQIVRLPGLQKWFVDITPSALRDA